MTLVKGSQMMRGPQISLFGFFYKKKRLQFFFIRVFFTDTDNSQDSRGREGTIFYSTLPLPPAHEHSDIFATLHVRWLSRIFNRNACVYQTATRWDLPPYRITIWVVDWWCRDCIAVNTWNVTMKGMIASNTSLQ